MIVGLIATNPAGRQLCLVGGFRYRLLNRSCRTSLDIDYHWDGDLGCKQSDIMNLLRIKLLPEVKRRLGYEGVVRKDDGPEMDSPFVKTVVATFYRAEEVGERIDIPVEITSILCLDRPVARTVGGTVYLTASDADMIESKVMALFNRIFPGVRDIVDLFLFQDDFGSDSAQRIKVKFDRLQITPRSVADRYHSLLRNGSVHIRAIDELIENQVELIPADHLKTAGGGGLIFEAVMTLLKDRLKCGEETGL